MIPEILARKDAQDAVRFEDEPQNGPVEGLEDTGV